MADWRSIVRSVAPGLATALMGPLAGAAVKTIAEKVLGKPEATAAEVEQAVVAANPELLLKLKQADQEFAEAMANAGIRLEEVEAQDRASARARQVAVKDWVPSVLALAYSTAFFALLFLLLHRSVPAENRDFFNILLGMLGAGQVGVMTYYFGSSSGSAAKSATIDRIAGGK